MKIESRSPALLALLIFSGSAVAQWSVPRLTALDATKIASAELKRRGQKESAYWIRSVNYAYERETWRVLFVQSSPQPKPDADITVEIADKTGRVCYIFGIDLPECAYK